MRNLTCSIVSLTILSLLFYSCLSSRAQNSLVESRESESPNNHDYAYRDLELLPDNNITSIEVSSFGITRVK